MKLSIIMSVCNERETISEILQRVREVDFSKETIVMDDGSTGTTREILPSEDFWYAAFDPKLISCMSKW